MAHTAETYREAAEEHIALAELLHEQCRYGAAHYWSGLAVECLLRVYRLRRDKRFDSRHDVGELVGQAAFYNFVPTGRAEEVGGAVAVVRQRWSNDHRYRPARIIARWLADRGLDRQVKGDKLKCSSAELLKAALLIVQIGVYQWTRSK